MNVTATTTPKQYQRFRERIIRLRTKKGWNQRQLSKASGIDQAVISRIESGERRPSVRTLRRLCDALEVSDELFMEWLDHVR